MYQYYKGYVIREGREGISGDILKELYLSVGWTSESMPTWLNEKFEIAILNSAWAYTVWDKSRLIGMIRVVSDKVMIASVQDLIIHPDYQRIGIGAKLMKLCLAKLPHGKWFSHTTFNNYKFYEHLGFARVQEDKEATLVYNGYYQARVEGNR